MYSTKLYTEGTHTCSLRMYSSETHPYTDTLADTQMCCNIPGDIHTQMPGLTLMHFHTGWAIWPGLSVCGDAGRIRRKARARKEK